VILLISNQDQGKIKTSPGACVGPPGFNFSEAALISFGNSLLNASSYSLLRKYRTAELSLNQCNKHNKGRLDSPQ
jgi:hypothetical protein